MTGKASFPAASVGRYGNIIIHTYDEMLTERAKDINFMMC